MNDKKIALIINSGSGSKDTRTKVKEIVTAFETYSIKPNVFLVHHGTDIKDIATKAMEEGFDTLVACGGDGTVSAVAESLLQSDRTLGVIPIGTLNHFAKDLRIPLTIPEAVEVIMNGEKRSIDAGTVNDKVFINNSGIGIYQKIVRYREYLQKKGLSKWVAFVLAFIRSIKLYPKVKVVVTINNKDIFVKTPIIFVGNNEYYIGGTGTGSREDINKGKLSVHIVHHTNRIRLFMLAFHTLLGTLKDQEDFDVYYTESFSIDSVRPYLNVSLDGEVVPLKTPLHFNILPKAIHVLVPKL